MVSRYTERICSVMFENVARSRMWTPAGACRRRAASSRLSLRVSMYCASSAESEMVSGFIPSSRMAVFPKLSTPPCAASHWP
jgi:hypothetical protein